MKFTNFLYVPIVFLLLDTIRIRQKKIPFFSLTFALTFFAAWWASGQKLENFLPFVVNSFEVSRAYSATMQSDYSGIKNVLYFTTLFAILFGLFIVSKRPRKCLTTENLVIPLVFFLSLKAGFIRDDGGHNLIAWSTLTMAAIGSWLTLTHKSHKRSIIACIVMFLAAIKCAAIFEPRTFRIPHLSWSIYRHQLNGLLETLRGDRGEILSLRYQKAMSDLSKNFPVNLDSRPIDVYPIETFIPIANKLNYQPRPVFQSYSAYTSKLLELNARHLQSSLGPQWLLFSIGTIDGRLPAQDESLSWLEILRRYQPSDFQANKVIFARSENERQIEKVLIVEREIDFGEIVPLNPEWGPIWAEFEISSSFAGKILNFAFKQPIVWIDLYTRNEQKMTFRLIPPMAKAGFLLAPTISNAIEFVKFGWLHDSNLNSPASFSIRSNDTSGILFKSKIRMRLSQLQMEPPTPNLTISESLKDALGIVENQ